ncbi:uncharacterized protein LOC111054055 [Nilaparvata lugens]|uniref:uncharacterized protein LOC111054055 n=1 Tax=Nilaparvata lugens TaxID=108931 RepID=UPI00193D9D6C|nr:uncharacterized protein LOC111054055 [Nilaparvata lugens]
MSGNRCAFRKCSNSHAKVKGLKMFSFPRDTDTANIWVNNSGNPELIELSPKSLGKKEICEQHFQQQDILPSGRLMRGAFPQVFCGCDSDPGPSTTIHSSSPASPHFNITLASPKKYPAKNLSFYHLHR